MSGPHFDTIPALAALAGVFALAALGMAARVVIGLAGLRARNRELEDSVRALRRELSGVALGLARSGERQQRLERDGARLTARVLGVEARAEAPAFDRAIASARNGAESDRLAHEFGLSRGEADLIARLHGCRKRA
jgi:hypothetical protein